MHGGHAHAAMVRHRHHLFVFFLVVAVVVKQFALEVDVTNWPA